MALRRAAQLLPRLAGATSEFVAPLSRVSVGNSDVHEHLPTPYAKAMSQWRGVYQLSRHRRALTSPVGTRGA